MQNNCDISQSPLNKGAFRNISAKIQPALPVEQEIYLEKRIDYAYKYLQHLNRHQLRVILQVDDTKE
jgi:hypothetical protein